MASMAVLYPQPPRFYVQSPAGDALWTSGMPFYPVRSAGLGTSLSASEKLEQRANLRSKNRLLKGRPIYSGNWDTWFLLTCCAYLCSNPGCRKMAKMAFFGDFEFLREVRVVMENVGK